MDTLDAVREMLDDIYKCLPAFEKYVDIFGSSDLQLLKEPLVAIFTELILFGVTTVKLFNRSTIRERHYCYIILYDAQSFD
jgi:hypothetical protein